MISLVFGVAIVGAAVVPFKYYFAEKNVAPLPLYRTYQEALSVELPKKIIAMAKEKKCRDYIIPVKNVSGDAIELYDLVDDLNLGLQAFSGWKLRVDEKLKKKMRKRADERFKIWGTMGVGAEMIALSNTQKNVAMKTNYSAEARCSMVESATGDDTKLVLSVNDERLQAKLFEVSLTFIHPETILNLKTKRDKKHKKIADLKKNASISSYALGLIILCYILYLFSIIILKIINRKKENAFKTFIANEIEKREELINEGHFVTALELANKYLTQFPYDTEIKAFKSRLLDYTNNDPEKAQQAFVEWKKLQSRMNDPLNYSPGKILSNNEKKSIAKLLPYHPELKASYNQLLLADEKNEKVENENALKMYDSALMSLRTGGVKETLDILKEITGKKPDFKNAVELKNRINNYSPGNLKLKQKNNSTLAEIIIKQKVLLGREDVDNNPDIVFDDRRVSRKHLSIEFSDGAFVVKDLESSGGTFVNGDKITSVRLAEGDLLNISKVIDYDVSIFRNSTGTCSGMLLKGKGNNFFILKDKITFDISDGGIKTPGSMLSAILYDGVLVVSTGTDTIIPAEGDEITVGIDILKVEVKN